MTPASNLVSFSELMDDANYFALVRQHRKPTGICHPTCVRSLVARDGQDETQPHNQRYQRKAYASAWTISLALCWQIITSCYGSGFLTSP